MRIGLNKLARRDKEGWGLNTKDRRNIQNYYKSQTREILIFVNSFI